MGLDMDLDKEKLLRLYPPYDSVLGPYKRSDGRMHVVLNNSNASKGEKGKTRTISYPKAIVESRLGRKLKPNEEIDHGDNDKTNNNTLNFKIVDGYINRVKQLEHLYGPAIQHYCPCGEYTCTTYSRKGGRVKKYCSDAYKKKYS